MVCVYVVVISFKMCPYSFFSPLTVALREQLREGQMVSKVIA